MRHRPQVAPAMSYALQARPPTRPLLAFPARLAFWLGPTHSRAGVTQPTPHGLPLVLPAGADRNSFPSPSRSIAATGRRTSRASLAALSPRRRSGPASRQARRRFRPAAEAARDGARPRQIAPRLGFSSLEEDHFGQRFLDADASGRTRGRVALPLLRRRRGGAPAPPGGGLDAASGQRAKRRERTRPIALPRRAGVSSLVEGHLCQRFLGSHGFGADPRPGRATTAPPSPRRSSGPARRRAPGRFGRRPKRRRQGAPRWR